MRRPERFTGLSPAFCRALVTNPHRGETPGDACLTDWACVGRARLREALRRFFGVIHRRDKMTPHGFVRELQKARRAVLKRGTRRVSAIGEAQRIVKRLRKNGAAYFTCITKPGVEPPTTAPNARLASS